MTEKRTNAIAELTKISTTLEDLIEEWNKENKADKPDFKKLKSLEEEIKKNEKSYLTNKKVEVFESLIEESSDEKPLLYLAAKMLRFDSVKIKDEKNNETKEITKVLETKSTPIDPLELQQYKGIGIGAENNKDWHYDIEKFNFRLTLKTAVDLGMTDERIKAINDSYSMSKLIESFRNGATPFSNTQLLKELNAIVQKMIGSDYKATSHDVQFLIHTWGKKDSKAGLSINAATHKNLRMVLMDILCNVIKTKESGTKNSFYSVVYKVKK